MAWPSKVYWAGRTKGVYYTANYGEPGDAQPTWAAVNTGLASTVIGNMQCDPFNVEYRQFVVADGVVYRREGGGDWEAVLTTAQARVLVSYDSGSPKYVRCDTTVSGRVWVLHTAGYDLVHPTLYALGSVDYGTTWTLIQTVNTKYWPLYASGNIDAQGDHIYVWNCMSSYQYIWYSSNGGANWTQTTFGLAGAFEGGVWIHPLLPTTAFAFGYVSGAIRVLKIDTTGPTVTALFPAAAGWATSPPVGGMWFDPDDADHMRYAVTDAIYITQDGWDTYTTNSDVVGDFGVFAPSTETTDSGQMILGTANGAGNHAIASVDGEGAAAAVGRAGTNYNTSPYTDAIPSDAGVTAHDGVWAIVETPTEGPTPPPGSTITPPGGSPITLGGTGNVQGVTMPDYTGDDRGVPLPGDRAAWDETLYGSLHARDIKDATFIHHMDPLNPKVSQEDFDDHVAEANPHNTALDDLADVDTTGVADGDALLYDTDSSKWLPADVLTPTEHTAIGNSAPHHAEVTMDANAGAILSLSTQEVGLDNQDANKAFMGPASGAAAAPAFRGLENSDLPDPLAFKTAASALDIVSGAVTATQNLHTLTSETGTTDDLATITAAAVRTLLLIQATATHTITVKHGTGNISLNGAADFELTGNKSLLLFWNGTAWVDLGAGGGGGAALTVEEIDGTPSVASVSTILVTNGTLTDNGGGEVQLDFGSAATDGAAIHDNTAGEIHAITAKATPVDADEIVIEDSADTWNKKRVALSALPGGAGDMTWAVIQASQLTNEVMNYPANVGIDVDLVAANQWWDSVGTPTTAATMVDVAGEAGITETWEYALKCVVDAASEGLYQRYTYADQPRIKSGRELSAIAAVWVGTAGTTVTMSLTTSAATEVTATATAQAWTIIKAENLTLDGTYVDLKFLSDTADTFYVVPLGVNIGTKAVPLKPRNLRWVTKDNLTLYNADPGGGGTWNDLDLTANTSALAARVYVMIAYLCNAAAKAVGLRRNGSSASLYNASVTASFVANIWIRDRAEVTCDDGQIIEYGTDASAANAETLEINLLGYWEWE